MEPRLPGLNFRLEQSPVERRSTPQEYVSSPNAENQAEYHPEVLEKENELPKESNSPILPPPIATSIVNTNTSTPSSGVIQASDDNPLIANDDDLIEKEWVDKAKKIIIETRDDPYKREREVGKLQVDYLRKRYGRELGVSS